MYFIFCVYTRPLLCIRFTAIFSCFVDDLFTFFVYGDEVIYQFCCCSCASGVICKKHCLTQSHKGVITFIFSSSENLKNWDSMIFFKLDCIQSKAVWATHKKIIRKDFGKLIFQNGFCVVLNPSFPDSHWSITYEKKFYW